MFKNFGDHPSELVDFNGENWPIEIQQSARTLPYRISRTPRIVIDSEAAFGSNDASGDVAILVC